tara:strand:- start:331 stop:588 length:258 start_codon:yes stop_codon:yes gene_type:complete
MTIKVIDTDSLDKLPAARRASATSYVQTEILYDTDDDRDGSIPEGKTVGDVKSPEHTRYTVSWDPDEENAALLSRIEALESKINS